MSPQTNEFESSVIIGSRAGVRRRSSSPKDNTSNPGMGVALTAFRALGRKKRGTLARGPKLEIRAHDGQVLASVPLALFKALSTEQALISKGDDVFHINLAEYVLPVAVKELIARITPLADANVDVTAMETTGNMFKDIHIASAAEFLGLTAYTQRMFNVHWHKIKTLLPSKEVIDVLTKIYTPLGSKLLDIIAHDMAKNSWAGNYNDDEFESYLAKNERFNVAVKAYFTKWAASSEAFEAREKRRREQAERREIADEEKRQAEFQALAKAKEDRSKERAAYAAKEKDDADVGKAVRAKMLVKGSKYTSREASYIWAHFGKRVPVALGH